MKFLNIKTAAAAVTVMSVFMLTGCGSDAAGTDGSTGAADVPVQQQEQQSEQQPAQQDMQSASSEDMGAEKIKAIVLAKVPGADESNIYEFEKDYDDGRIEYEGSIYYNGYEYEFEVDGATGNILTWEIDD